jgi:hypothetical protein
MGKRLSTSETVDSVDELQQFTLEFFSQFGAMVRAQGRKNARTYAVDLPSDLADHFGRATLDLCFRQRELAPGLDLVTPGSRIFDRMMTLLDNRGAMTFLRLPVRQQGSEELMRAVRPVNVAIAGLKMQEQQQLLFVFNWRITYRADDKREELYTVVLDESGLPLLPPCEGAAAPPLNLAELFADATPAPPEHSDDGQMTPPRLPPMTHLTRLAETARKYAIYHADVRCVTFEAEILPRLYKALQRLTTYYQQQMEETYDAHDPSGEKREALEADLQRKRAEEVENHRLRVDVSLVSYAILQIPVATADLTLSDGKRETPVRIRLDRYTGRLHRPTCHACAAETFTIAVDRNGHVTCDACIRQCTSCQEIVCAQCGVSACPQCGRGNCDSCSQECWACGERACAEHISQCPVCMDAVCHRCQVECAHCGVRQCRSHLRADHVAASKGVSMLVCTRCAMRCPGCQQYSVQMGACSASGQRFCDACLVTCARCSQRYGPGFYHLLDGWAYCTSCLTACPRCQSLTAATVPCATCGATACTQCGQRCDVCGQRFCADHARSAESCEHVLCDQHTMECYQCHALVCPLCDPVCGICERAFCPLDAATCQQCGQTYCHECVRRSGVCDTCATHHREGVRVNLADEPCAGDPQVAKLIRHFYWTRSANQRYLIYTGDGGLTTRMVVVVDQLAATPKIIAVRKVPPLEALLGRLWR